MLFDGSALHRRARARPGRRARQQGARGDRLGRRHAFAGAAAAHAVSARRTNLRALGIAGGGRPPRRRQASDGAPGRQFRLLTSSAAPGCRRRCGGRCSPGLRWSSGFDRLPARRHVCDPDQQGAVARHRRTARHHHDVGQPLVLDRRDQARVGRTPAAPPDIDFNMCSDERDMERLVKGVKLAGQAAGASRRAGRRSRRFFRSASPPMRRGSR